MRIELELELDYKASNAPEEGSLYIQESIHFNSNFVAICMNDSDEFYNVNKLELINAVNAIVDTENQLENKLVK